MVKSVGVLPLGWRLESIEDFEAIYRFEGECKSSGVRRRLTLIIRIHRVMDTFWVEYPKGLGEFREVKFDGDIREIKHFVSKKMDGFTRKFHGLTRKRTPIYNITLPS